MLQVYKEKETTTQRSKRVALTPALTRPLCHNSPIVNIHHTHDGGILTVQEDGAVCHCSPELKPLKTKHVFVCWYNPFVQPWSVLIPVVLVTTTILLRLKKTAKITVSVWSHKNKASVIQ